MTRTVDTQISAHVAARRAAPAAADTARLPPRRRVWSAVLLAVIGMASRAAAQLPPPADVWLTAVPAPGQLYRDESSQLVGHQPIMFPRNAPPAMPNCMNSEPVTNPPLPAP